MIYSAITGVNLIASTMVCEEARVDNFDFKQFLVPLKTYSAQ